MSHQEKTIGSRSIASMLAEIGVRTGSVPVGRGFTASEMRAASGLSMGGTSGMIADMLDKKAIRLIGKRRLIVNGQAVWHKVYEPAKP